MAKSIHVYSTMSSDNVYAVHKKLPSGLHKRETAVLIYGKANVSNPTSLMTPTGMVTTITEEQYKAIKDEYMFKKHIEGGYLKVQEGGTKNDAETVAKDMKKKDKSAQKTKADYEKKGAKVKES